jgi:hypothetical protein
MDIRRARKDLLAGAVFMVFGLAFAVVSTTYPVGSLLRMGPGYFPLVLGGLLVVLGALIVARGLVSGDGSPVGPVPWRAIALITGSVVFFGLTVRGLGLVPSLFVTALLSAFAGDRVGARAAVAIAGGLTVLCVLIFVVGLQLRLPLIGPWIPV